MKYLLIISCFILSFNSYTQEQQEQKVIRGKLYGKDLDKTSINIINKRNGTGANSDFQGYFTIKVLPGDTLIISSVQFQRAEELVTPEIIKKGEISIDLQPQVNELDEIMLSNVSLSGHLSWDIEEIELIDKSEFGLAYVEERTGTEKKLQAANRNFFASFFNSMSGKTNSLEEVRNIEEKRNLIDRAINAVPAALFEDLNLPSNLIKDFIYYCAENPNFHLLVAKERRLELVEYYQMKAPKYLSERE